MDNRDPAHYLQKVVTTNTPKRLLWLDCSTQTSREQGLFVDRWRAGALGTTHYTSRKRERVDTLNVYRSLTDLWARVDGFCVAGRRTVLFGYDLAAQLRVSQAMLQLPLLGWSLDKIVLERTSAWARYVDGRRTLMLCDLKAFAPIDLAKFASDVEYSDGAPLVDATDPPLERNTPRWRAVVIRESVLQIFAWIEAEQLGPFRPTGSGQSYSAFRRRFMTHKLLVHDDVARLQAERLAMHTGRCEAWQHGQLTAGPYVEYDLHAAYCNIASQCDVPTVAGGETKHLDIHGLASLIETHAVLADVTVTTDVPCVPTKLAGRTVWPVGTFRTWLWDPELTLAMNYCKQLDVHHAYKYARAPALQTFSTWVLAGMKWQNPIGGLVPKRVLKHWSRCLVGRLGLRYRSWVRFGTSPESDLRLVTYIDTDEGTTTDMLCAGYDRFILADMCESLDSLPQIPSWVMSECRARLWEAIRSVGQANVLYVDTDSMIVRNYDPRTPTYLDSFLGANGWVRKATYKRLTIHGPRNYHADHDRHIAGLPLTARQTAPLEFTGQVMRSIKESMRAGQLDCVATLPRHFTVDAPDLRRQHLADHKTAPYRVQLPPAEED